MARSTADPMARALALAASGRGRAAPNPPVGAVVVRDGVIVGEGRHTYAGVAHAEAIALAAAGPLAAGATLHVTLEPCCHHGRTPPCTDAIIAAGITEVRYAVRDPDPRVSGGGHRALAVAGLRVRRAGAWTGPAREILRGYLHRSRLGRPWVTAKFAMSLDGKTATRTGDARWISGEASRAHAHVLRDRADAVVVGVGTVLADDPRLTVRPAPADGRQPVRVVVDTWLRTPLDSALVSADLAAGTLIAVGAETLANDAVSGGQVHQCGGRAAGEKVAALTARGVTLLALPLDLDGRVDLPSLLATLAERGHAEVLVEGGGELLAGLVAMRAVDEIQACVAPIVVGGRGAPTPVGGAGVSCLSDASSFEVVDVVQRERDVWIVAHPIGALRPPG